MESMQPVMTRGRVVWDRFLLPAEEFQRRVDLFRGYMEKNGIDGAVVFGNTRKYAHLCYFTNFIPSIQWGLVVIPLTGDPVLIIKSRSGSVDFKKSLTWVSDVRKEDRIQLQVKEILGDSGPKRVGVAGAENSIPAEVADLTLSGLRESAEISDVTKAVEGLRVRKSDHEKGVMSIAYGIAKKSMAILLESNESGLPNYQASINAELNALREGVQDVRISINKDEEPYLFPAEDSRARTSYVMAYVGVMFLGYWAEVYSSNYPSSAVSKRIDNIIDDCVSHAKAGRSCTKLVEDSIEKFGGLKELPFVEGSIGNGIGLSIHETPQLRSDSQDLLQRDEILSLRLGLLDPRDQSKRALGSRMILVGEHDSRTLHAPTSLR